MVREERRDEHGPVAGVASAAEDGPAAVEETKEALRHLASSGADPGPVIDRAVTAVDDPAVRARGERALAAFRRFRAAAASDLDGAGDPAARERDGGSRSVDGGDAAGHFHPGPGTDLRDGAEPSTE